MGMSNFEDHRAEAQRLLRAGRRDGGQPMTGMTPECLDLIRERVESDSHIIVLTDAETALCESDREDLLIEVDRLRAGIEEVADEAEDAWNTTGWWAARRLRDLLNPTEGEDQ